MGHRTCALPPQSSNLIEIGAQFPFPLYFGEDISSCNRGRRSSCKMGALYEELARCIRIFGSFAGGKRPPMERKSIGGRQIGTVDQISDLESARKAALVPDLNARMA